MNEQQINELIDNARKAGVRRGINGCIDALAELQKRQPENTLVLNQAMQVLALLTVAEVEA